MSGPQKDREVMDVTVERFKKLTERLDNQFSLSSKVQKGRQYAIEHPVVTMILMTTLAFCTIPLLCFFGFVLTTFFFTFVGFIFVEGLLLTVGTLLLGGVLCIVGFLSFGLGTFLALAWLSARAGHQIIENLRRKSPLPWRNLWPNATEIHTVNGECVKDYEPQKNL